MKDRTGKFTTAAILLTVMIASLVPINSAVAVETSSLVGDWEGYIEFSSIQPAIKLNLNHSYVDGLTGKVTLPEQNIDFQVENFTISGDQVKFDISNDRTNACFEGTLDSEFKVIEGNFIQAGYSYPFKLESKWMESVKK